MQKLCIQGPFLQQMNLNQTHSHKELCFMSLCFTYHTIVAYNIRMFIGESKKLNLYERNNDERKLAFIL